MGSISDKQKHPNSIVYFRGKKGWSIHELALAARLDEWTVRQLEVGNMKMHVGHVTKFCQVLDCTEEQLLEPCRSQRNPQIARRHSLSNLEQGRGRNKWAGKLTIPPNAPALVREMFELMNEDGLMISDVAEGSGVAKTTVSDWRYARSPGLLNFDAVLNNMGYKLAIVRVEDDQT